MLCGGGPMRLASGQLGQRRPAACQAAATALEVPLPLQHRPLQPHFEQAQRSLEAVAKAILTLRQTALGAPATAVKPPGSESQLEQLYDELEEVFHSKRGFRISAKEQRLIEATGGGATYGEIEPKGIDSLMNVLDSSNVPANSVFCDLGSGLGRVLLHSALTGTSGNFCRLIGLELSDSRLEQAEYTLERLRDAYVDDPAVTERLNRVEFHREDVTSSALSLEATHVFMCSTAFGAVACRKIVEQLYQSEHFQVLVTSRELPLQPHLIRLGDFPAEMSWNTAGTCHVYVRRDLVRAPPALLRRFLSDGEGLCWLPSVYGRVPIAAQEPVGGYPVLTRPLDSLCAPAPSGAH